MSFHPDCLFSPEPGVRKIARDLYGEVTGLPIVSPHGHVDPRLFADANATFGSPADLLIIPDHYITRLLYSQGIPLESLGVPRRDGGPIETDHRKIWRIFCEHFDLFQATPSGLWLENELQTVFGIEENPSIKNSDRLYDDITAKLASAEFRPRRLFERFNIEVLCTTDAATDDLRHHRAIRASGWTGRIIPCFRPDGVVNLNNPDWRENIATLGAVVGREITSFQAFVKALEARRAFFKELGATATDHAVLTPFTTELSKREVEDLFQRALHGGATRKDALRFTGHMLMEFARMSVEDGLVMQLHAGAYRDHNRVVYERFGADTGGDIPTRCEFTRNLRALLNKFGNDPRLTLVLFTLDETTYSRELAPLAGHYPAVRIGPPWWFFDSPNGIRRYFENIVETAGLGNTAGFNDDTRAFCSIPSRHDVWRRVSADWVAELVARKMVSKASAREMMADLAGNLARRTYQLS